MQYIISKSQFKPQALEYLREVEKSKKPIVITHLGKPVVKIVPFTKNIQQKMAELKNTVLSYKDPASPVGKSYWEALK